MALVGLCNGKIQQLHDVDRILLSLMGGLDLPHWKVVGLALLYLSLLWPAIQ